MMQQKNRRTTMKHINIHQLNSSELQATRGGEYITCGNEGDLCTKLTVVTQAIEAHASHKVVLA